MMRYLLLVLVVASVSLTVMGQEQSPAPKVEVTPAKIDAAAEKQPEPDLVVSVRHRSASATQPVTTNVGANWLDLVRVPLALVFVVGLILGMKWLLNRGGVGKASQAGAAAVTVISRTALPPKQQVLLLKVGRRVLVTWSNGAEMGLLSEVTDPQEVSELIGRIQEHRADSISQSFASLFSRQEKGFGDLPENESFTGEGGSGSEGTNGAGGASGGEKGGPDVTGLRQQIQNLRQRFQG